MDNAIGYVRVSTAGQADSGLGLDDQRRKVRALAELHDYALVEIIEDAGESAATLDRPGWKRIETAVKGRKIKAVLIAKLDRATRSVADCAALMERFGRKDVALLSAAESLDTGGACGRMIVNMMAVVSQWEREVIGERTSAALQELKRQGRATGPTERAPYGFTYVDGMRVAHAVEQATLARIAALRIEGLSFAKVAEALNGSGVRTRTGGLWSRSGVHAAGRRSPTASVRAEAAPAA